ncbi:MAG: metallophosphoesterase [Bacteroidota bacterium]|nr:metallophosphoesterase [Bacteroidota bacterium]
MKIIAITDIHGEYDIVEEIIRKESPDLLIIGGDLTTVGSIKEAEQALQRFKSLCKNIFCVAGNMDLPQHDGLFERLSIGLNGKGVQIENIGFFGVSGCPLSPLRTPYEISEEEITERIERGYLEVKHAPIRILVSHAPPFGTKVDIVHLGIHVGSMAVRSFIEDEKPDVVICGHIHEGRGQDKIEISRIINCGMASHGYYVCITIMNEDVDIKNRQLIARS